MRPIWVFSSPFFLFCCFLIHAHTPQDGPLFLGIILKLCRITDKEKAKAKEKESLEELEKRVLTGMELFRLFCTSEALRSIFMSCWKAAPSVHSLRPGLNELKEHLEGITSTLIAWLELPAASARIQIAAYTTCTTIVSLLSRAGLTRQNTFAFALLSVSLLPSFHTSASAVDVK